MILLPVAGLFFSVSGWLGIQKYPTELSGKPVALIGLALNLLLSTIAPARHAYIYATEVRKALSESRLLLSRAPWEHPMLRRKKL